MWDIDVNYLFFRNNFATPEKLKEKLVESYGTYAYSCQCSWQNNIKNCRLNYDSKKINIWNNK